MAFSELMNDTVSLLKKNGERVEGIKASVQRRKIIIDRSDFLIESGDLIQRKMSNGGEETYKVIDPNFHEQFGGIPAHYQIDCEKLGLPAAKEAVNSITYNISGHGARVNNHSIDNSVNFLAINTEIADHISLLRKEIKKEIPLDDEQKEALDVVDVIEEELSTQAPRKSVVKSLINGLPNVGNISSIGSFFIAVIDKLIQ